MYSTENRYHSFTVQIPARIMMAVQNIERVGSLLKPKALHSE